MINTKYKIQHLSLLSQVNKNYGGTYVKNKKARFNSGNNNFYYCNSMSNFFVYGKVTAQNQK